MQRGVTIIEILITIAILGIIVGIIGLSFAGLNSSQALDKNTSLVASIINEARSMTLSSIDASQYGVNLQQGQVTLFKGSSYSSSDTDNIVTPMHSLVGLRDITLAGGGVDVIFRRLTGHTDQAGTFEIYLINEPTTFHTITVSATGITEVN